MSSVSSSLQLLESLLSDEEDLCPPPAPASAGELLPLVNWLILRMMRVKQAGQHFFTPGAISVRRKCKIFSCTPNISPLKNYHNSRSSFEMTSLDSLLSVVHFLGRCLRRLLTLPLVVVQVGMGHTFFPGIELDVALPEKKKKKNNPHIC